MDAAAAAFVRQQQSIAGSKDQLQALIAQAQAAESAIAKLNSPAAVVDAGRDQAGRLAQIRAIEQEQANLATRAAALTRTIAAQEAALDGTQSSLQRLGSTIIAVEQGQAEAAAQISLTTRALNEQAEAAVRVTAIQQRINDVTGVNRPSMAGTAAASSSVLLEADNLYRLNEARAAAITKLREQEAATASLADAELNEQANRQRFGISDDPRGAQARESAAAFLSAAEAEEQMAREAAELRAQLNPLGAVQERNNAALARYRELARAGIITTDELAAAEARLAREADEAAAAMRRQGNAGRGAGAKPALFGLKPYELTNLGYQVNDVVTQLASGTGLAQVLAQQGGQILQLFPRIGSAIAGALKNPLILAFVATIGTLALGLKEAADQADRLRDFSATLAFRGGDSAGVPTYNAADLSAQAEALERLGVKAAEADTVIKSLMAEGIDPARMDDFARAAKQASDVLGTSLVDAAKQVAEAFTGGFEAIAALDDKLNFLTASERAHIKALFEEGNAQAARTEALNAYSAVAQEAADKQRGPWGEALKSISRLWDDFIKFVANSLPIRVTIGVLNALAGAVKGVADAIYEFRHRNDAGGPDLDSQDIDKKIAARQAEIRKLEGEITRYNDLIAKGSPVSGSLRALVKVSESQLADAKRGLKFLEGFAADTVVDDPDGSKAKRRGEKLAELSLEDQLQNLRLKGATGLTDAESKRREELAGQIAFNKQIIADGDQVIAQRLRERAVAAETRTIEKERAAIAARLLAEGSTSLGASRSLIKEREGFLGRAKRDTDGQFRVGYGSDTVVSANGTVSRVNSTTTTTRERADVDLDRRIKEFQDGIKRLIGSNRFTAFSPQQQAVLTSVAYNYGSLPKRIVDAVRTGTAGQIAAGIRALGGDNKGINRTRRNKEAALFEAAPNAELDQNNANRIEDAAQNQDNFNIAVRQGADDLERQVAALTATRGLTGQALLDAERLAAQQRAEADLREKVEDANKNLPDGQDPVVLTQAQIDKTRELIGQQFDLQNAREAANAPLNEQQRLLDALRQQKGLLEDQIRYLREIGDFKGATALERSLETLNAKIAATISKLIALFEALTPTQLADIGITSEELAAIIAALRKLKNEAKQVGYAMKGISGQDIAEALTGAGIDAFNGFIRRLREGKGVIKSFVGALGDLAVGFVSALAKMILQLLAYAAAVAILIALGVPPGLILGAGQFGVAANAGVSVGKAAASGGVAAGENHSGGIAGSSASMRRASPSWFAAALRYHGGGIAGLAPDEVPSILRRGEEVLTEGDPRHRNNGGLDGGGGAPGNVTLINSFDPDEVAELMLRSPAGERTLLNIVRNNQGAFKAALG